jgi:hypothetical protein
VRQRQLRRQEAHPRPLHLDLRVPEPAPVEADHIHKIQIRHVVPVPPFLLGATIG